MSVQVSASTTVGYEAVGIDVECDLSNGLPTITVVGLANKSIDEAKERIRSAVSNSSLKLPRKRIILNLAPAHLPKEGTAFDLPMALAILSADGQIEPASLQKTLVVGELALNGDLRPVKGVVGIAKYARDHGFETLIVPYRNATQASLITDIKLHAARNLREVYEHLIELNKLAAYSSKATPDTTGRYDIDFADVHGQTLAKRALEIAAAGHHNVLMDGPPGTGKTMLAKAMLSILPPLENEETLEVTQLQSLDKTFDRIISTRPFRAPHHTASHIALVGGGRDSTPGEISLSHKGVLFMDELPEFPRSALEALRQPLEDRTVTVARVNQTAEYPADFMLIATQNPCPCGYLNDPKKACICTAHQINQYQKRVSGPLMDRIDLFVTVDRVNNETLLNRVEAERSADIASRVGRARGRQRQRFGRADATNAGMSTRDIKRESQLSQPARELLDQAAGQMDLSARSYMRTLKVARTIADLANSDTIDSEHISEALQYRQRSLALI